MRNSIAIILAVLISALAVQAAEVTVGLDRAVVLNDPNDMTAESRIALSFTLPEEVVGSEIIYVELYSQATINASGSDSLFEFRVHPLIGTWSENDIDFESSVGITDSMSVGAYTVKLNGENEFHVDITSFVMETSAGERTNYGLIALGDLLGDGNIRLPNNLGNIIRRSAQVKILYK